jgi:hypothetical protein
MCPVHPHSSITHAICLSVSLTQSDWLCCLLLLCYAALDAYLFLRDTKAFEEETHKILARTVSGTTCTHTAHATCTHTAHEWDHVQPHCPRAPKPILQCKAVVKGAASAVDGESFGQVIWQRQAAAGGLSEHMTRPKKLVGMPGTRCLSELCTVVGRQLQIKLLVSQLL